MAGLSYSALRLRLFPLLCLDVRSRLSHQVHTGATFVSCNLNQPTKDTQTSLVEVERKFVPSSYLLEYLHSSDKAQKSIFRRLQDEIIRDTYYDLDDQLCDRGTWIRRRRAARLNLESSATPTLMPRASWEINDLEAKIKLGGGYKNSQFQEVKGRDEVARHVASTNCGLTLDDLKITVDLQTYRQAWKTSLRLFQNLPSIASLTEDGGNGPEGPNFKQHGFVMNSECSNDDITIVIDYVTCATDIMVSSFGKTQAGETTDESLVDNTFNHIIGEVEMTRELHTNDELVKKYVAGTMDKQLGDLVLANTTLFSTQEKPVGKLSAFFAWQKNN